MKKIVSVLAVAAALFCASAIPSYSTVIFQKDMVNAAITSTSTYTLDLSTNGIRSLSVQLVYSTASPSAITFTDGTQSSGSFTIGTLAALTTAYATNNFSVAQSAAVQSTVTITIISTTALSGHSVTLGGYTFTADTDFASSLRTPTQAAKDLAAAIDANAVFQATNTAGVVFATVTVAGVAGNDYTVSASSPALMSVSALQFAGGAEKSLKNAYIAIFTGSTTNYLKEGVGFTQMDVASNTAISIKNGLNSCCSSIFLSTVQQPSGTVVFSTAVTAGTAANSYAIYSSTGLFPARTFTGGQDNSLIKIAGYPFTANSDYPVLATSSNTVIALKNAINASALKGYIVAATANANTILIASSTAVGKYTTYPLYNSNTTAWTASGESMTNGTDSDFTLSVLRSTEEYRAGIGYYVHTPVNNVINTIYKTPTALGIGSELLLTTTAGTAPSGLTAGTTYFVCNSSASSFQLASSKANAVLGTVVAITGQTETGGGSFTLTPLAMTMTGSILLQASNDGTNYSFASSTPTTPLSVTNATASTSVLWNLGEIAYRYLRLAFNATLTGATNIRVLIVGRD